MARVVRARLLMPTGRWLLLIAIAIASCLSLIVIGNGRNSEVADVLRVCLLLIAIPLALFAAVPTNLLARARGRWGLTWVDSPLVAPILTPVVLGLYFFTPAWVFVLTKTWMYVISYPLLLLVGLILHVGLKGSGKEHSSASLGLQILLSLLDLVFDAIPGIAMRLSRHVIGADFWAKPPRTIPIALHNQSLAGAILWFLAEISDLPIIAMVFIRWIRVDEDEARRIDALLDAQEK